MAGCTLESFGTQWLYLCISNPMGSQVAAFGAQIEMVTDVPRYGQWELVGIGINVGQGDNHAVGYGADPQQPNEQNVIVLMKMQLTILSDHSPDEFCISGYEGSIDFPDSAGYAPEI